MEDRRKRWRKGRNEGEDYNWEKGNGSDWIE